MHITFVLPPLDMSGGILVVAIYAKLLTDHGHHVTLVSPPHKVIPLWRKTRALLKGDGWPSRARGASHLDGLAVTHRVLDRFRPVLDKDVPDADVVIATWWETAEWVNALNGRKGAKVYFVQGHEVYDYLPIDRSKATYRMPLHKIVVARWIQDLMRSEYDDASADLVPNSVDHSQFFAPRRGKQPRPTVGFLYHEAAFKGLDVVIAALPSLRANYPDLRVICFGSVPPGHMYPLDRDIEFHLDPPQDQIRNLYAQCDAWLTASRSEGFNLPAMEAMACRTPVVATKTGWPVEAVVTGWNGVLIDVDDVDGLARGARWVLDLDEDQWGNVSEHAHQTVAESSWEKSLSLFERSLMNARNANSKT